MVTNYAQWVDVLRHRLPEETAGQHIVRLVQGCAGISLKHEPERLADLFLCNETEQRAALISEFKTNCATIVREFYCLAGCDHEFVICPYVVEMAMTWVLTAAADRKALREHPSAFDAGPGWVLWYGTPGKNDDHLEVCLEVPDPESAVAWHGGGGRTDNAITLQFTSILTSRGRPLRGMIDPEAMCTNPATGDNPY